jgi:hypothetical protein
MSDVYDRWLKSRAESRVPEGFVDRVVARARGLGPVERVPLWIAAAAGAAFLMRAASMFLVFVTG